MMICPTGRRCIGGDVGAPQDSSDQIFWSCNWKKVSRIRMVFFALYLYVLLSLESVTLSFGLRTPGPSGGQLVR